MQYFVDVRGTVKNTADIKAPADMCAIMQARGYTAIPFRRPKKPGRLYGIVTHIGNWRKVYRAVKPGDLLVYQYPLLLSHYCVRKLNRLGKARKATVVLLIHDIDSIRGFRAEENAWKEKTLDHADFLICHNEKMKAWLEARGVKAEIVPLGIFDYLTEEKTREDRERDSVIIAGNLSTVKSPYIGKLLRMERKSKIHLYGPHFMKDEQYGNYEYHGSYSPERLTGELRGGFGLVWDGDDTTTCSGMTGEYLRYNNPHKASLYIASGIPALVWKEAALAGHIERNGLGLTIGSLEELDDAVSGVTDAQYEEMLRNVKAEAENLRNGRYLNRALDRIENKGKSTD